MHDSTTFPHRARWSPCLCGLLLAALALLPVQAMADADILAPGAVAHELTVGSEGWSERDNALYLTPRVRLGLEAGYEIGISGHMRDEGDESGLRHLGWEAGIPLQQDGNSRMALGLYGTLAQDASAIGSGHHGLGVELRMDDELADGDGLVTGRIGIGRSDRASGVGEAGYSPTTRLYYDARYEHIVWSRLAVGVETAVSLGLSGDELQNRFGMAVRPGVRYDTSGHLTLRASVGQDLPGRGIEPDNTVLLSLSHRPTPPIPRRVLIERMEGLAEQNRALEYNQTAQRERILEQGHQLDTQGRRLEAVRHKAGTLTVEVVNSSGIDGLGEAMAERLLHKGHHVVAVRESTDSDVLDITHIRYQPGLADEAVGLGHVIRHIQIVTQERDLPGEAEIRILVGRDQANNTGESP